LDKKRLPLFGGNIGFFDHYMGEEGDLQKSFPVGDRYFVAVKIAKARAGFERCKGRDRIARNDELDEVGVVTERG
jgi:hypothetical protein